MPLKGTGKVLFQLDGTKEKSVLGLDAFLKRDKKIMKALHGADEVYEPYGGSLVYLLNMSMLYGKDGRLLKPTHVLMARSFDSTGKVDIVEAIRNADEATLQDIRATVVEGKKPKTGAATIVFNALRDFHGKQLNALWKQDFDRIAQVLRDPNLHLHHDGVDTDIFSEIIEKAQQGRKIFLLDDSDYADMPFEYGSSKYKGVGEQVRKNAIAFLRKHGSKHYLPESTWRDVNDQMSSTSNDTRISKNINYLMMQKATVLSHVLNAEGAAVIN